MNFTLPEPECNRAGTGNKFNLIMRSTVTIHSDPNIKYYPVQSSDNAESILKQLQLCALLN